MFGPSAFLLCGLVILDVFTEFSTGIEGPHVLYFGGWFFYLGILLTLAGMEYGFRSLAAGPLINTRLQCQDDGPYIQEHRRWRSEY